MNKKKYLAPDAQAIMVKPAEIVCTSGTDIKNCQMQEYLEDNDAFTFTL